MDGSAAAGGMDAPANGLSGLVARMVQREAAESEAVDLAAVAVSPDDEIDRLQAAVDRVGGEVEAVRAWCEGLEARQAQLAALLRLRLALRAGMSEGSGSG